MHQSELDQHHLRPYIERIRAVAQRCWVGVPVEESTGSYFGGMPTIDRPFAWPKKDGYPLHFIGQLQCSYLEMLPMDSGVLLFFYDNRHFGYSSKDRGHAVVLYQQGEETAKASDLPEWERKSLWGLRKRRVTPTVYRQVHVAYHESLSYPSLDRNLISLDDEEAEESYAEFCGSVQPLVQVGGFPSPIQSDAMEADCAKIWNYGQAEDWLLLLQLFEIGDMRWGDVGALYWFIHQDDLHARRWDRVWMISQCH